MAKKALPHLDLLRKFLDYDGATGIFLWLEKPSRRTRAGSVAGSTNTLGYRQISIDGLAYLAHRVAWKLETGCDPVNDIDHINGDKSDNRIANLCEITRTQSKWKQGKYANNKSGHKGVSWHKATCKWSAQIGIPGKNRNLGLFTDINDAAAAYATAATALHGKFLNLGTKGNNNDNDNQQI